MQAEFKKGKWNNDEIDFIKHNYGKITTREIGKILNRSMDAVQLKGRRLGLKVESSYHYNQSYFHSIDQSDKAYWMGFIMADGCVTYDINKRQYGLSIQLAKKDQNHLRKFNKSIEGNVDIYFRRRKGTFPDHAYNTNKEFELCTIRLYSQQIANDLISHGVYVNKTYKNISLPKIKDDLIWDFIRGFVDGDGHICVPSGDKIYGYRVGITNNCESFLREVKEFMKKYGITSHVNKSRNNFKLEIRNRKSILKFIDLCYDGSDIYLDRKYFTSKELKHLLSHMET